MAKKRGIIFVISSPSGCGKTTVCNWLKRERFDITHAISVTTRHPRHSEKNGKDYYFIDKPEFRRLVRSNRFLEWANNFGDLYGTLKGPVGKVLSSGKDVILSIDVKGAMKVRAAFKNTVLVFLLPPSIETLRKRLTKRGTERTKTLGERLKVAKREMAYLKRYDYSIVNKKLAKAVDTLKSIIIAERSKTKR